MLLFSSVSISWRQGFCCKYYLSLSKVEIFSKTQPGLVGTKSLNDLCIRICFSIQSRISYMKFKKPENCREETVSYGLIVIRILCESLFWSLLEKERRRQQWLKNRRRMKKMRNKKSGVVCSAYSY